MSEKETHEIEQTSIAELLSEIDALRLDNWRLVQILCLSTQDGFELSYSFGGGYAMKTLRVHVDAKGRVPSITPFYRAAYLYENEIRDLFGVMIERISPDWEGRVYDVAADRPFDKLRVPVISSEGGGR